jgi:hypothetical protein
VTDWQTFYLAAMAVALVVMAAIQIGVIVVAIRVGRQVSATAEELRREVKPLVEKAHRISDDAARVTALAVVQAQRVDRLLESTAARVDETLAIVQQAVVEPVRQGAAVVSAVRAAFTAFRAWRHHDHHGREDDDALFVG